MATSSIRELVRDIGRHGDIMAESEAFLLEIGIDYSEFPQEVLVELPVVPEVGWSIPEEVSWREDKPFEPSGRAFLVFRFVCSPSDMDILI